MESNSKLWIVMVVSMLCAKPGMSVAALDGNEMPESQDTFGVYERLIEFMSSGSTFIEAVAKVGAFSWDKLQSCFSDNSDPPVWLRKQCNVTGDEVMSRCSCFEMMNMGEQWLQHARVSGEEYRQLRRRAAKLHHPDKSCGSDAPMRFLTECSTLLCGDEKCMNPDHLRKPATDADKAAKDRRKEYINDMRKMWAKCERRGAKTGAEKRAECYQEEVEEINLQTFASPRSKARSDVRSPRRNAHRGHEEQLLVFLDDSYSMKGDNLAKAKKLLKMLFPRFEKTPTAVHLIGGSAVTSQSSIFKERVQNNGGLYDNTMIRATLIWNNCNDLDLHVREPDGNEIYYKNNVSSTKGELDIDRNVGGKCDARPVENIRWQIGASQPKPGHYEVLVNHYGHDSRASIATPFEVEVAVGPSLHHFEMTANHVSHKPTVFEFDFSGSASPGDAQSRQLFPNTTEFTLNDIDTFWQADAWSTHLWEYIYEQLRIAAGGSAMTEWDVLIVTDGVDNDSPGAFLGPAGFNEMMNRLHRQGMFPRVNVFCIGNKHCTGDAGGAHHYRDLVLASGGAFVADAGSTNGRNDALAEFAALFTASRDDRVDTAHKAQQQWLKLVHGGASVSNKDEQYTQELLAYGVPGSRQSKNNGDDSDMSSNNEATEPSIKCHDHGSAERCTFD